MDFCIVVFIAIYNSSMLYQYFIVLLYLALDRSICTPHGTKYKKCEGLLICPSITSIISVLLFCVLWNVDIHSLDVNHEIDDPGLSRGIAALSTFSYRTSEHWMESSIRFNKGIIRNMNGNRFREKSPCYLWLIQF